MLLEAAQRHASSNKGKALRGEPFWLCNAGGPGAPFPCPIGCDSPQTCPAGAVLAPVQPILGPAPGGVGAGLAFPIAKGFGQLLNLNCAV